MIRLVSPPEAGWGDGIVWSDLDDRSAEAAITAAIVFFADWVAASSGSSTATTCHRTCPPGCGRQASSQSPRRPSSSAR